MVKIQKLTHTFFYRTIILTMVCICLISSNVFAIPEVSCSLSQDNVLLGDSIILTVKISGVDNPQTPEVPDIDDFSVDFRGMRQESFSHITVVIQGTKVEKKSSDSGYYFDFALTPHRAGSFVIPSFPITAAGKIYHTQSFNVQVLDKAEKSENIFVKVKVDKNEVYLGEKIVVTFKWYLNKDISDYYINIPWLDGLKNFLVTDPELDKNFTYQKLIVNGDQQVIALKNKEFYNGQPYTVISFQKILTPILIGKYNLEPVFARCNVVTGYKRNSGRRSIFDDFFDSDVNDFFSIGKQAITEPNASRSNAVPISVLDVPLEDKPHDYCGAVGNFEFQVKINPVNLKVGEPITVTMKVSGTGNIEQVEIPVFPEISGFKSYETEIKLDSTKSRGKEISTKVFEKVLIPRKEGDFSLPEIKFVFFDSNTKKYQTIKRGPFKVHVDKGEEDEPVTIIALSNMDDDKDSSPKKEIKIIKKDIRYIKPDIGELSVGEKEKIYEKISFWILFYIVPILLLIILFIVQKKKNKLHTDIGFARNKKAMRKVKSYLAQAQKSLEDGNVRDFYSTLSKGLNSYLSDKLNRSAASVDGKIVSELEIRGLDVGTLAILSELYRTFDSALFSAVGISLEQMNKDYLSVKKTIGLLERILK